MLKTYKKRTILIAMLIGLFFTFNLSAQTSRERAVSFKQDGDRYSDKQDYKTAVDRYLKAIDADKTYPDTFWSMAFSLSKMHEHKLAALSYTRYLEKVTDTALAYVLFQIGNEYRLAKEFDLSKKAFDLALTSTPKYIEDYEAIADIYSYRGDLTRAVEYQTRAVNFSNSDDDLNRYIGLSWYYSFLQQHQNSVNAATKAIQLNSDEPMAYTNRCRAYNDLKLYDKAVTDCKKALSLRPDHGETQYYMANSYRAKGNTAEATRLNKQALPNLLTELESAVKSELISLPDYCYILGNALFEDGKFTEAVAAYELGLEFKPSFTSLRFNLGMAYLKVRNKQGATEQYRELLNIDAVKAKILKTRIDAAR